ncbi:MAG: NADH-quinone oxidoreductase subunit M [Bacteroidota bacterium]
MPILSTIVWLPILSLGLLLWVPARYAGVFRWIALGTTLCQGLGIGWVARGLQPVGLDTYATTQGLQFVERWAWMRLPLGSSGVLSLDYFLGVDGFNIGLLLLCGCILTVGVIASWPILTYAKAYFGLYLLLDTLLLGSLVALDFLLFYIFFEATLIPLYFLIGFWGGARRTYAAQTFLLYTALGTVLILFILIALGLSVYDPAATALQAGLIDQQSMMTSEDINQVQVMLQTGQIASQDVVHSLSLPLMTNPAHCIPHSILGSKYGQHLWGQPMRWVAFGVLTLGWLIKLAIVPWHTWLPIAHVQAPTPISILLASILLKIGGYGLLRTAYSIFPEGALHYSLWMGVLGLISMLYAGLNALGIQDLKGKVAYASIAHMGLFLIGLASLSHEGICGALYQMVSHGLTAALLFLVVGVLEARTQDRDLANYSGLAKPMPRYTVVAMIVFLAAMGVPGFSGFIAELLILLGVFKSAYAPAGLPIWIGLGAVLGLFLNTTYWIWTIRCMFWGDFSLRFHTWRPLLRDLSVREYVVLIPLGVLLGVLGVFPQGLLGLFEGTVRGWIEMVWEVGQEGLEVVAG